MPLTKFTDDPIVKRLRWVMIGAMLFSLINTLSGQPNSFWQHPETAVRGDGLSIFNKTNYTFDFFLGHGWQAYLLASLVYLAGTFLIVSVLPRLAALITIFSFIFAHFYDGIELDGCPLASGHARPNLLQHFARGNCGFCRVSRS